MNILILATVAWLGATCTFARSVNVVEDARLIEFIRILDQGPNPIEIKNWIEFWFEKTTRVMILDCLEKWVVTVRTHDRNKMETQAALKPKLKPNFFN